MSEMVERVARAIVMQRGETDPDRPHTSGRDGGPFPIWTFYIKDAKAAIKAMREPTEAMVGATGMPDYPEDHNIASAWRDMIDAALKE